MKEIKRGEIYSADFGAGFGSEQGGIRPILILQNNTGNKHSPTTIVAAITSRKTKTVLPTHVTVTANGLKTESTVLLEQIRTIDKARLGEYIGRLDSKTLAAVDRAIVVSLHGIKCYLEAKEIPTPAGCSVWRQETIRSILSNEKYKGDAIINKTYVSDCISKRIKANNGERNKYYIENNHPAIIDAGTFARVQEEIARRSGKPKVKQKGTKTELSRYSSKYALSELLICGECRTPYRRCTWTAKGKRKIVWRCINRLDYGKKYCHHSPSIEESLLQDAVMRAIMQTAKQNIEVLKTLKIHIGMGLTDEVTEDKTLDIQIRIAEIDAEFQKMLKAVSADNADGIDEERITELMNEKQGLTVQLEQYATMRQKRESAKSRLDEIFTILDGLQNHQMKYDDKLVRQIIECVVVESKEKIKVVFIGGTAIEMTL